MPSVIQQNIMLNTALNAVRAGIVRGVLVMAQDVKAQAVVSRRSTLEFIGSGVSVSAVDNEGQDKTEVTITNGLSSPVDPTDDGKIAFASGGTLAYAAQAKLIAGVLTLTEGININAKSAVFGSGGSLALGHTDWSLVSYISSGYHMWANGPLLGDVYASLHPSDGLLLASRPVQGVSWASIGTSALTGTNRINLGTDTGIFGKTSGGAASELLRLRNSDGLVLLGDGNQNVSVLPNTQFVVFIAGANQLVLSATAADFQDNTLLTTGTLRLGVSPSQSVTEGIRLSKRGAVYIRNEGGTADIRGLEHGADDRLYLGDHVNTVDITFRAATGFAFQQGATPTTRLSLNATNADFTSLSISTTGSVSAGSTPAGTGAFRCPNNSGLFGKTSGGTDIKIGQLDSDNVLRYGQNTSGLVGMRFQLPTSGDFGFDVAGTRKLTINATSADFQDNNILTTGFLQLGSTVAASGDIRGTTTFALKSRTSGGTTYALVTAGSDGMVVGDNTGCAFVTYRTASGNHQFEIGSAAKLRILGTSLDHISKATVTTTAGQTNIALLNVTVPTDKGGVALVYVTARDQTNGDVAGYVRSVGFKNAGGTVAIVGTPLDLGTHENDASWNIDIVAGGGATFVIRAAATDASNSVKWDIHCETLFGT